MSLWKIKRDTFYSSLCDKHGYDWIVKAGFLEDNSGQPVDLYKTTDIMCTPINFMRDAYAKAKKPAILLTTGSFCPIHDGHIKMMEDSKAYLESLGWDIIGGYFCPDHDEYIESKVKDGFLPIHKRLKIITQAVKNNEWLAADPWAGVFMDVAINFTDIIERTRLYIERYLGPVPIIFVCGGDNARFIMTFEEKGHCIVVGRKGLHDKIVSVFNKYGNDRTFYLPSENDISSTLLRKTYVEEKRPNKAIVRTDLSNEELDVMFCIRSYFNTMHVKDIVKQKKDFSLLTNCNLPLISLDPLISTDYNLAISRRFDCFGLKQLGYCVRPESKLSLYEQLDAIPEGDYFLFDDDIHTGGTVAYAKQVLEETGHRICGIISLTKSSSNEEVIDARDFLIGKESAGLVMTDSTGETKRVPYFYNWACPYSRSSISNPAAFSKSMETINRAYGRL